MSLSTKEPDKIITRKDSIEGLYRLSGLQHGMLFHGLYDPGTGAYVNHFKCDLLDLDTDIFQKCWEYIVKGHSILRSVFYHDKLSMPVQCVFKEAKMPLEILDIRSMSSEEKLNVIRDHEVSDAVNGFDFNTAPLMRIVLFRTDDDRHRMLLTYHHIILDGWSISILMQEFLNIYDTLLKGNNVKELPADKFEDFIRHIERIDKNKEKAYWKNYLKDIETGSLLPHISKTAEHNKGIGDYRSLFLKLDKEVTEKIQSYAKRNRITVNTVMQSVWSYCLHRYTGNKNVVFGVIVSGRPDDLQKVESRVGLYINPLPLHSEMNDEMKITDWLQKLQKDQVASRQYQNTAIHEIMSWTGIQGDLFDCLLTFENFPVSEILSKGKGKWNLQMENFQTSDKNNYPLTIIISVNDSISIRFSYNTVLLKDEYVNDIVNHFKNTLLQVIENEMSLLKDIDILTKAEESGLKNGINASSVKYPAESVVDLFEKQVLRTPENTALVFGEESITYEELNLRSNRLAHYLQSKGVRKETLVPLFTERGIDMVTGMLGIMKAGGAYVPVDTDLPSERISFILEDTKAEIIVSSKESRSKLPPGSVIEIVEANSDTDFSENIPGSEKNPETKVSPEDPAYVIYTSGSTGNPKGVIIEHRSLVDYVYGLEEATKINECSSFALVSTIATDLGNTVIYSSLLSGGALHLFRKESVSDAEYIQNYFKKKKIECLKIVPSHWKALSTEDSLLLPSKLLVFGGEALQRDLIERIKLTGSDCKVVNHYGPTETTIGKLLHVIDREREYDNMIPIGKPFSNTEVFILSKERKLCPAGVPGELFIAGEGLARGYLNNAELTEKKFIENPFAGSSGGSALMYGTGDLVKYLPDGNIEFIGRADDQVKIRGYRIEPGEIERTLDQCDLVKESVVLAREDKQGNKRLVGYIVSDKEYSDEFDRERIMKYLKEKLPDHMVPSVLLEIEKIPLTANGKTDRKALPDPDVSEQLTNDFLAPRNEVENVLTEIWQELLDIETIGIHDNFFELGGDSIITIQVVSRARKAGFELQVGDVFTYQTIARLSALLDQRSEKDTETSGEQFVLTGASGLLPIQQWYFEKFKEETNKDISHFNQSVILGIDKGVTESILKRAIEQIKAHHDALRFKYYKKDGKWHQVYEPESEVSGLVTEDLRKSESGDLNKIITEHSEKYQRSLDIEKGDLIRIVWMQTPDSETQNRLLIVIHHLAVDGVSWRILLEDLELLISGLKDGSGTDLGRKSSSYRQWYDTLEKYGKSERFSSQEEYWRNVTRFLTESATINTVGKNIRLPSDKEYNGIIKSKDMLNHSVRLDAEHTRQLIQEVPRVYHTEINDILISALACTLSQWLGSDKVVIEMEGHGRETVEETAETDKTEENLLVTDTSHTVGWFTTHYPVVISVNRNSGNDDLIKSVKEQLREVPDKGLGYGVLKYINKDAFTEGSPEAEIIFNYLGQSDNILSKSQWFTLTEDNAGSSVSGEYIVSNKLSVIGMVQGGELIMNWTYSGKHFEKKTIEELTSRYKTNLELLIEHCREKEKTGTVFTPSDYGLGKEVSYKELDVFLDEEFKGKQRRESIEGLYGLSGLQQGMLFHGLYDGGSDAYIRQLDCELSGPDLSILKKCWESILKRHSILRSAFYHDIFNIPVQCVYREAELPVEIIDLRNLSKSEQESVVINYVNSDKKFDFKTIPLMRIELLRLSDDRFHMIWTWHHILFDGWSMPVLLEELLNTYEQIASGKEISASEEDRYQDYIVYLERQNKNKQKAYWSDYMKGVNQSTLLPFISSASLRTKNSGVYETLHLNLEENLKKQLEHFIQSHHITLNTLIQGIWSYLLFHYTGSEDITYGVVVSGRPDDLPGVEYKVGMFINTIPLRSIFNGQMPVNEWLQKIQQEQVLSRKYQYTPLTDILRWTGVSGDLFDSILVFENYPVGKLAEAKQWSLKVKNLNLKEQSNYPLSVLVSSADEINIEFKFNTDILKKEYVKEIRSQFENVLKQLISDTVNSLDKIELLSGNDKNRILTEFISPPVEFPRDKTMVDLFEEQVAKTPDNIAVVFEGQKLTYKELNERSNKLANYLISKGVVSETLVPLCMERSIEMITGILAVLKAGGAYVPVDPDYPEDRIKFMIEDTGAKIVLSSKESSVRLPANERYNVIEIDSDSGEISGESGENPGTPVKPGNLAYVIYTSGSTGKPKGVLVEHYNVLRLFKTESPLFDFSEKDVWTLFHSFCFDFSVWEMYGALFFGGRLVIVPKEITKDASLYADLLISEKVTVLNQTPSAFYVLQDIVVEKAKSVAVRYVIFGGEALVPSRVQLWKNEYPECRMINMYGITETTVHVTYKELSEQNIREDNSIIGKTIPTLSAYILNKEMQLVSAGVAGELHIGGSGLARGYLNQFELTSERFIKDPFSNDKNSRLYKTGDLGRWLPDGNIEYLGRIDDQVKIRGFRIELGEIESVIQEISSVKQSVVIAQQTKEGSRRLVGYVVPDGKFDKEKVTLYLRKKLPDYMVPAIWVEMESLPLTSNGKTDRKALPDPDAGDLLSNEYVAPRNATEEKLAVIWSELLGAEKVGVYDNFFELGGDSIITIQVVSRARRFGYELKPKDIFIHQTISGISAALKEKKESVVTAEQGVLTGQSGLLPIQQWYFVGAEENISHFNQSLLLSIDKEVTEESLSFAIEKILYQHDALRFIYKKDNGGNWNQEYSEEIPEELLITIDVRSLQNGSLEKIIRENSDKYQSSLDIEKGEIVKFVLFKTPESEVQNRILIIIHHLAVDGVSWRIIIDDLELLITGLQNDGKTESGLKSSSYRQWYEALKEYGKSKRSLSQKDYWNKTERSYEPLKADKEYKGIIKTKDIGNRTVKLEADRTQLLLQEVPKVYHTEINDMLLCALALTLCEYGDTDKIVVGLEGHGREDVSEYVKEITDTSRTVGWFTSLYPVLLELESGSDLSPESKLSGSIKSVKEQLRRIPDKGIGYGVKKYLNKSLNENLNSSEIKEHWDIVFNYLGQLDNAVNNGKWLSVAGESGGLGTSQDSSVRNIISVNARVQGGALSLNWSYSKLHFEDGTIEKLTERYITILDSLISHCIETEKETGSESTPSDFGLGEEISHGELDKFLKEPFRGKERKDSIEGIYRLSGLQEGMLFHGLYDERSGAYTEQLNCDLKDPDLDVIKKSWNYVLSGHSILRSGFYHDEFSIPVQCVYNAEVTEIPVEIIDLSEMTSEDRAKALNEYEEADRYRGFDFRAAPLMRISLIRTSGTNYRMIWTSHHILFDGWSMPILMEEFLSAYESLISGKEPEQREDDRYEDYIRYTERTNKEKQENYWRKYMNGVEESTLLPFVGTTDQRTKGIGAYVIRNLKFDSETTSSIENYTHKHKITVNTLMQGIWSYLLHQYTGSNDIVYGVIVSGRPDELNSVEKRVGMYINTLPLRSLSSEESETVKWLQNIQNDQVSSREFQHTPLNKIQEWTGVNGDLFDSLLVFENYPVNEIIRYKKWKLNVDNVSIQEQTNYPLTLIIGNSGEINIKFSYNSGLLSQEYINEICGHFENVLIQMISNEDSKLKDIELLTEAEKNKVLFDFNNTKADHPENKSIVKLFEEQAFKTPHITAAIYEGEEITYKELNERSNKIANYLKAHGVKEGTLVPVCISRSIGMIAGVIGILKAGGAYVPVDPDYPEERIRYILKDTSSPVILTDNKNYSKFTETGITDILKIDGNEIEINRLSSENIQSEYDPDNLTYVLYTSGSTGNPKGVRMPGRSLINLLYWQDKQFKNRQRNVLQFANLHFDVSFQEIFSTLCFGSTLYLISSERRIDMNEVLRDIKDHNITNVFIPCIVLKSLAEIIAAQNTGSLPLQEIIVAGEQLKMTEEIESILNTGQIRLINQYGPTEAHVVSSYNVERSGTMLPPIGKPVDNTQLYILRDKNKIVPVGIPGELIIGGVQVACGYLNLPGLTDEKFIKNPVLKDSRKVYCTGDLARWLPDGNIEFLGRKDDQVKIRGYRIEPGEIESVLNKCDFVKESVILAKDDKAGNKILVGYIVPEGEFSREKIIKYLKERLPEYMIPAYWVELAELPLTGSGKTDRLSLPDPDAGELLAHEYTAPRNDTEEKLASIWKHLLGIERVGVYDNFFELGGNSLLAMRAIAAIRKEFSLEIQMKALFEFTCIDDLSRYIELAKMNKEKANYTEVFDI